MSRRSFMSTAGRSPPVHLRGKKRQQLGPAAIVQVQNTGKDSEVFKSLSTVRKPNDERPIVNKPRRRLSLAGDAGARLGRVQAAIDPLEVLAAVQQRQEPEEPLDRLRLLVPEQLHEEAVAGRRQRLALAARPLQDRAPVEEAEGALRSGGGGPPQGNGVELGLRGGGSRRPACPRHHTG